MVHLYRIAYAVFLAALSFVSHAGLPQVASWIDSQHPQSGPYSSAQAACSGYVAQRAGDPGWQVSLNGVTVNGATASCGIELCQKPALTYCQDTTTSVYSSGSMCPANSTSNGTDCTCSAGFEEKDGQCKPVNPCPAGQHEEGGACVPDACKPDEVRVNGVCVKEPPCPAGETRVNGVCKPNGCPPGKEMGIYDTQGDAVSFYCEPYGGKFCTVKVNPAFCVTVEGFQSCAGTGRLTGGECSGGSTQGPPTTNPTNGDGGNGPNPGDGGGTGPGSGPGDGGGTGPGTGGGTGPGTGPGDGGGTGPGTGPGDGGGGNNPNPNPPGPNPGGPSGNGSVKPPVIVPPDEENKCPEGYRFTTNNGCVQETRPPDSNGACPAGMNRIGDKCVSSEPYPGGGGDGNGDGDGDGDGDDSMFSGSCMAGFVCEGDAIQCSIAREQHRRACKLFDDKSAESDLYDKEKGKEGEQTKDLPGNREESMANRISTADAFGSGQCIQDLSVIVGGQSISLPFSKICPSLAIIGNIMVAVSLLLAIRIVGRG